LAWRWASPVLHFRRTTTGPTELQGREIAEGVRFVLRNRLLRSIAICTGSAAWFMTCRSS